MSEKKDTFCPLPWNHLATHPNGMVSLCCKADTVGLTGFSQTQYPNFIATWKLSRVPIPVIVNGESFCQTRLDMLSGKEPAACKGCFDVERNGGQSKRMLERSEWPALTVETAQERTNSSGMIEANLQFLELRLGNKCNLKCATCNPISSDQWSSDYDSLAEQLPWIDQKMTSTVLSRKFYTGPDSAKHWSTNPEFWKELYIPSSRCKKIYINGGEPMLNVDHIEFLKRFVVDGTSKDIDLIYSTNVTSIPKDVMHDVWSHFKRVDINASVDHVGDKNTLIRYPAKWDKIERTLLELKDIPAIALTVIQTISAYNFLELEEFHKWTKDLGVRWWVNHVDSPDYLSVFTIPVSVRRAALGGYQELLPPRIWEDLTGRYQSDTYLGHDKFVQFNNKLDSLRGTNWRQTLPLLSEVFK